MWAKRSRRLQVCSQPINLARARAVENNASFEGEISGSNGLLESVEGRITMHCAWVAAIALSFISAPPDASTVRYELGRRLRAFEVAFDSCVDPGCRKAVARHLQDATGAFFGLRLLEAGRSLDLARLRSGHEEIPQPLLWAASLAIEPSRRALSLGAKSLPLRIDCFYEPQGRKPDGARMVLSLEREGGEKAPRKEITVSLDSLPLETEVPLDGLGEGDHALVAKVLAGGARLDSQRIGISLLRDLEPRLDALRSGLQKLGEGAGGSQVETVRGIVSFLGELASRPAVETDVPAARLLREAEEALGVISKGEPFYGSGRPGEYRMQLKVGRSVVPARVLVPRHEGSSPAPLVLALHGMGGSENLFFDGYGHGAIVRLCAERGWLLAAPRSGLLGGVPVLELIDEIARLYPVDTRRVFLVGHSMGAMQSIRAASAAPERFAAVAVLGGASSPRDPAAFRDLPVFIGAGDRDFALGGARRLRSALEGAGARKVVLREYPDTEHLAIVQVALPDVFRIFDEVSGRAEAPQGHGLRPCPLRHPR
jgi:predicted esterase